MSEERRASDVPLPGGNFRLLVSRLGYQALISLGLLENPATGTKDASLPSARMLIDDLDMLRAKTEGNLEPDELEHIEKLVRDLEEAFQRVAAGA